MSDIPPPTCSGNAGTNNNEDGDSDGSRSSSVLNLHLSDDSSSDSGDSSVSSDSREFDWVMPSVGPFSRIGDYMCIRYVDLEKVACI